MSFYETVPGWMVHALKDVGIERIILFFPFYQACHVDASNLYAVF